jgi:hypothetical protein
VAVGVWFAWEGPEATIGEKPAYVLPLKACIDKLGLEKHRWWKRLDEVPHFPETPGLGKYAGYKHVICEIDEAEEKASGWRAGFYRAASSVTRTREILQLR